MHALPIFPLSTVLFPGGVLPLRIFETRYMDMVSDRMRHNAPFGVCTITRGGEVGTPAEHETVGCLAHITDFDMQQPGLLQLRTVGGQRFRIERRSFQPDGLIVADTVLLPADPELPVPPEHAECAALIRRIVEDLRRNEPDPQRRVIEEPCDFESTAWVANRLAEFLPIAAPAKHKLMALDDPGARLAIVHRWLQQHGAL
jgi:Lon protease-like protein